jgi:hypothetical protein
MPNLRNKKVCMLNITLIIYKKVNLLKIKEMFVRVYLKSYIVLFIQLNVGFFFLILDYLGPPENCFSTTTNSEEISSKFLEPLISIFQFINYFLFYYLVFLILQIFIITLYNI